ncbi:IclR family transcriptional regulator domain-containing protein [Mycolicibacterium sp.]|uniref:IclR family transcriptional regulator domain-containing protein n=1 Tax=Mycolicibacterium sp. TaxID=2320850 RepID=UPI003D0E89FA
MRRDGNPEFIEALARGLDVIRCFRTAHRHMSLSEVAAATDLARPTARRILITLEQLGYVRNDAGGFSLTPRVLELGMAYVGALDIRDVALPHLQALSRQTGESCSMAQLDGSDIVYVARAAVPKLVTLSVTVGTRFPALPTSLGKVLLAALSPDELEQTLAQPSRTDIVARWQPGRDEMEGVLRDVRAKGWASTDQQLASGIRSVAAPVRDGDGRVTAAINVNANASETSMDDLVNNHLPALLNAASAIGSDWELWQARPMVTVSTT